MYNLRIITHDELSAGPEVSSQGPTMGVGQWLITSGSGSFVVDEISLSWIIIIMNYKSRLMLMRSPQGYIETEYSHSSEY